MKKNNSKKSWSFTFIFCDKDNIVTLEAIHKTKPMTLDSFKVCLNSLKDRYKPNAILIKTAGYK